ARVPERHEIASVADLDESAALHPVETYGTPRGTDRTPESRLVQILLRDHGHGIPPVVLFEIGWQDDVIAAAEPAALSDDAAVDLATDLALTHDLAERLPPQIRVERRGMRPARPDLVGRVRELYGGFPSLQVAVERCPENGCRLGDAVARR